MKKILSLLLLCIVLSSCGIFKNVKKDKYEHEIKLSERTDSSSSINQKTIDKGSTTEIDKGVVTTERKTTKVTETQGSNVNASTDLGKLTKGETYTFDSAGIKIKLSLDTLTKNLTIDVTLPNEKTTETIEEKTTEKRDQSKQDQRDSETDTKQAATVSQSSGRQESLETDNSESTPKNTFWYAVIVLGIVGFVAFLVSLVKKFK